MRNTALQYPADSHCASFYQPLRTRLPLAAHTHELTQDHRMWDKTHVAAGEIVRTALGSICTAVAMSENRHRPGKKSEQGWVHLVENPVGWPAVDHKLAGKGTAGGARDNFQCSTALGLETAEPGSLTKYLKCPLRTAVSLDATSERKWCFGILAALRPLRTYQTRLGIALDPFDSLWSVVPVN